MTEFVIVAPFLALTMAGLTFFRDIHVGKIASIRMAREEAWARAYGPDGCNLPGRVDSALANFQGQNTGLGTVLGLLRNLPIVGQALSLGDLFTVEVQRSNAGGWIQGPTWYPGGGAGVGATHVVYCNETVPYDDLGVTIVRTLLQAYWASQFSN